MDFVSGALALSLLGGGTVVAVTVPNMGPDCNTRFEMRADGVAQVTRCDGVIQKSQPAQIIAKAAKGTGGLVFRDEQGNDLGSGIGENQSFIFVNCGPENSGLISVYQMDTASDDNIGGGWGGLYTGYVKKKFTENPSDYPCN